MEAFHTPVRQQWVSKLFRSLIPQRLSSYGNFEKHKNATEADLHALCGDPSPQI